MSVGPRTPSSSSSFGYETGRIDLQPLKIIESWSGCAGRVLKDPRTMEWLGWEGH